MSDDEASLKDVVKVGVLGEGTQGTVWSARKKGRSHGRSASKAPYALKRRLVKAGDAAMRDTKTSSVLRELEFYKKVANRHPALFSKLYDWDLSLASHIDKESFKNEASGKSMSKFTHVFTTLSARKEGVLRTVYQSLNRAQWMSMLAQVCYAIALLHDKGFSHGDVWEANVAFVKVPRDKDVHIYRSTVPSLGYEWSIIDYGSVELKEDETAKEQKKKRASSYELDDMISLASGEDDAEKECADDGVDIESSSFRRSVLSSLDGPSVRLAMRKTGLPLHQVLALVNLDSYLWHVCGHERTSKVKPWVDRGSLARLSDVNASYSILATYFARMTRDLVRRRK